GASTRIVVRNQSGTDLQLWWLSTENERIKYEQIAAGETLERQTYAGHVWLITEAAGTPIGWFEAREQDNSIDVAKDVKPEVPPARENSRRRRSDLRDRRLSPDGKWRAALEDHNLRVVD